MGIYFKYKISTGLLVQLICEVNSFLKTVFNLVRTSSWIILKKFELVSFFVSLTPNAYFKMIGKGRLSYMKNQHFATTQGLGKSS